MEPLLYTDKDVTITFIVEGYKDYEDPVELVLNDGKISEDGQDLVPVTSNFLESYNFWKTHKIDGFEVFANSESKYVTSTKRDDLNNIRYHARQRLLQDPQYRKKIEDRLKLLPQKERDSIITAISKAISPSMQKQIEYSEEKRVHSLETLKKKSSPSFSEKSLFYPKEISLKKKGEFPELEASIQGVLAKGKDVFPEFIKLWHDKENFGPVPATLIFLGYIINDIPIKALQKTWTTIKKDMSSRRFDPTYRLPSIGEQLKSKYDYTYCSQTYNFLVEFFEKGLCNCECSSFLIFQISKLLELSSIVFVNISKPEPHAYIVSLELLGTLNGIYGFESTGNYYHNIQDYPNIRFGIYSEQIMAVSMILTSALAREMREEIREHLLQVLKKILNLDTTLPLKEALRGMDRTPVKNLMDSNTYDIFGTQVYCRDKKSEIFTISDIHQLNTPYIEKDITDCLYEKKVTEQDLKNRMLKFTDQISDLLTPKIIEYEKKKKQHEEKLKQFQEKMKNFKITK